jgi:hypothetical protein
VHRISVRESPPLELGAIAGDALHNLRAALDILWRNVWHPIGGGRRDRSEFPFPDSAESFKARTTPKRSVKPRAQSVMKLLRQIMAYKGGNKLLWALHEADAADKHRLLIPTYARVWSAFVDPRSYRVQGKDMPLPGVFQPMWGPVAPPIEDGAMVYVEPIQETTHMHKKPEITLDIAFGSVEVVEGQPMLATLLEMTEEVEGVVRSSSLVSFGDFRRGLKRPPVRQVY